MADLAAPKDDDDLYLYRGAVVSSARPVLQGDVYSVETSDGLVMVVTHPCSMRQGGGALRERLAVVEVVEYMHLPESQWKGHVNVMPLPNLFEDGRHFAGDLRLINTMVTTDLIAGERVACLSEDGIQLLQQRHAFHLTRVAIDLPTLYEHSAPILVEAELEEEWVDALDSSLPNVVAEFQGLLGGDEEGSLRRQLHAPHTRAGVRRHVRQEIARRLV